VLNISDVFILPSLKESFGLAALEAMASSVPVISTNSGGLPEVIENGASGFLSNVGDVQDMAKNMMTLLKDNKTLENYKKNALKRAADFDIQKILPLYENLYQKAVKLT
jgi:glycosyltransferase involved in cell wall biosynthesis